MTGACLLVAYLAVLVCLCVGTGLVLEHYSRRHVTPDGMPITVAWGAVYTTDAAGVGVLLASLTGVLVACVAAACLLDYLCGFYVK